MALSRRIAARAITCCCATGMLIWCSGCSTTNLVKSRQQFYAGHYDVADETLQNEESAGNNSTLFYMERATIRQQRGDFDGSNRDFLAASDNIERLETYSVSKGGASLLVNDQVQDFRGVPFERTLVHAFAAKNYLALYDWDDAAVEARRIIISLNEDTRGDYPEDAYSRYMAGFCLEMIDDPSNAALQYSKADALRPDLKIDPKSGRLGTEEEPPTPLKLGQGRRRELVCFVLLGRAPRGTQRINTPKESSQPYAEIYANGKLLGRSYTLSNTAELYYKTDQVAALKTVAKTGTRIAIKEGLAQAVENNSKNDALGDLVRFVLIGLLEQPDVRRWETLPRYLQVARVQLPDDAETFDVVFKDAAGSQRAAKRGLTPLSHRHTTYFSFVRDLQEAPPAKAVAVTLPEPQP